MKQFNEDIRKRIIGYLEGIPTCRNETARKERFISLISQIFPKHSKEIFNLTEGADKFLKVQIGSTGKSDWGFVDSLYGNLVIEFEHKLPKMLAIAEEQLKDYVAKLWSAQKAKQSFLCVASDGVYWVIYTPILNTSTLSKAQISPKDVELVKNELFEIAKNNIEDFYYWIDRIFFRENLLSATSQTICAEFGIKSFAFIASAKIIQRTFERASEMKELKTAFDNWSKYLKYTYGNITGSKSLFVRHSYLSAFAKILMAHVLSARNKKKLSLEDIDDILTGQYFLSLNIRNYVEKDFFYWINFDQLNQVLKALWTSVFHSLKTYNFSKIEADFLKDIYQDLIDPEDRHDLGEYYTPDWLCEKIIKEALVNTRKDSLPRIGDITCGSGSFLRAAIRALRNILGAKKAKSISYNTDIIQKISRCVIGFEIHPLAVFIAKTNYMLALEDMLGNISKPFSIPVYLCDSLLNAEMDQNNFFSRNEFKIQFFGKIFSLPITEALTDERFDELIDYIERIAHTFKLSEIDQDKVSGLLESFIAQFKIKDDNARELIVKSMTDLTLILHQKVINQENTIWAFILKNNFRPIFFSRSFDIVVGNPPWLSFRYIESKEYRKELEKLGLAKYGIVPKSGKLRTHMELATIFLAHGVHSYLVEKGVLYFVLPRSIFSSDHHSCLRENRFTVNMVLDALWDLSGVKPLFNVPACVLKVFHLEKAKEIQSISGKEFSGKLPRQNVSLSEALEHLTEKDLEFFIEKMGKRTAISQKSQESVSGDDYYQERFRQGATIVPRNYYFVEGESDFSGKKIVYIKTSQSVRKNSKKPYKDVNMSGQANIEFLFRTCLAENVLPLVVLEPFYIHLPVERGVSGWTYISPQEMLEKGFVDSASWFQTVENSYNRLSSRQMTFFEWVNYYNKLLAQNPEAKYWVLYCTSGKHLCAAVLKNNDLFWADATTYWSCPSTKKEAYYLAGILNSSSLNQIIKPFQSKGLLGERHIHKKILDIGIPRFVQNNSLMNKISDKTESLSELIKKNIDVFTAKSLGKKRNEIREHFKKEFAEIDKLVMKLFK